MRGFSKGCLAAALVALAAGAADAEALALSRAKWQWTPAPQGVKSFPAADAKWNGGAEGKRPAPKAGADVWIRGEFTVPGRWKPKSHVFTLEFPSIGGDLVVFLNGKRVGERLGPFGYLDVSDCVTTGDQPNQLLIYATSTYRDVSRGRDDDILRVAQKESSRDNYPRRVGVLLDPVLHVTSRDGGVFDAWAETSWRKKKLTVRAKLTGVAKKPIPVTVKDAKGRVVKKAAIQPGADRVEIPWDDPILWDIDKGYLYTCEVGDFSFPFGFREVWVEGRNVMMNGHPLHLRIEMHWFPFNEKNMPLFRAIGLNAYYIQAHPNAWFRYWHEVPDYTGRFGNTDYGAMLDLADREGVAMLMPAVTANALFGCIGSQKKRMADGLKLYKEMNEYFLARTRRHPSIIAHCASMNLFNPKDAISPQAIGVRRKWESYLAMGGQWPWKAKLVKDACDVVKKVDPTRLVYAHAEGCVGGDFATANNYQNLTPAQEVWEYPDFWSKQGDMPYFACEFGVYDGSYFKDFKRCLLTEYDAIYIGPRAYAEETDAYRDHLVEAGLKNNGYGSTALGMSAYSPAYDDLQSRFERAADVSWRTYGMFAWHHFVGGKYGSLTNLNVHGRSQAKWMQPFLGYVGGYPEHVDKTHMYRPGEKVEKGLVAIWDSGAGDLRVKARWSVVPAKGGDPVADGKASFTLTPFASTNAPVAFKAPGPGRWALEATFACTGPDGQTKTTRSRFPFEVRSAPNAPQMKRRVWLYDPAGESRWVLKVVRSARLFAADKKGRMPKLAPGDILVVGRNAVDKDSSQPHTAELVRKGLRVLYLEQQPASWDLFGLTHNADVFARNAFFAVPKAKGALATLYAGLGEKDLSYWRGSPTLVPEYRYTRPNRCGAPKGSGRHAIASTVFEIPSAPSYRPLFVCEFDLNYTPLLEWDYGRGCVVYNSFDFTGRIGRDVSATALAANLFRYLDAVAPDAATPADKLRLHVGLTVEQLKARGINAEERTSYTLPLDGEMAGVLCANLVRWRDKVTYAAITEEGAEMGGAWFRKGDDCYLQVAPEQMDGRYKDVDSGFRWVAINTSVERLRQLVARVQTYLGAAPAADVAAVAAKSSQAGGFERVAQWNVLGPYEEVPAGEIFGKTPFAFENANGLGEAVRAALAGDLNPNFDYTLDWGGKKQSRNFRLQVAPDGTGAVRFGEALHPGGQPDFGRGKSYFAYAVSEVESATAREAILALNLLGYAQVYLNGELLADLTDRYGRPDGLNAFEQDTGVFRFRVKLNKGRNVLTLKLAPYNAKNAYLFAAKVSDAQFDVKAAFGAPAKKSAEIYDSKLNFGGAYGYHYW